MKTDHNQISSVIKLADRAVSTAVLAALLLILAFASYTQIASYHINRDAESFHYTAYKPTDKDNASYEELKEQNPDVIGWLTIDGTKVDYPLVQGKSNNDYINTSVFGEYSLSGSIFLDVRNHRDFSDSLSIVYGHHMADDLMFGCFDKYADKDFFEAHRTGNLFFDNQNHQLTVFAYLEADGYDTRLYNPNAESIDSWISYVKSISNTYFNDVAADGHLLLLSTCASGETNGRMVIVAKISEGTPIEHSGGALTEVTGISIWILVFVILIITLIKILPKLKFMKKQGGESMENEAGKKKKNKTSSKSIWYDLRSLGIKIGIIIGVFILIEAFVFGISINTGDAMSPNLNDGDIVITFRPDKSYEARDVILYKDADGNTRTGRVIAKEGDTVEITDKGLKVNGYFQQESYAQGETTAFEEGAVFPITLGKDELFILGDNREKSKDSRIFGVINKNQTYGRVITSIRHRGFR